MVIVIVTDDDNDGDGGWFSEYFDYDELHEDNGDYDGDHDDDCDDHDDAVMVLTMKKTAVAHTSFDQIFDLTAVVYFKLI